MKIVAKIGSITTLAVDAIVNPANSFGYMGGGVAGAIKKIGGQQIEDEAVEHAPIQVGTAVVTTAGDLPCKKVIHAPTMHNPSSRANAFDVTSAVRAALELAQQEGFKSIAIPGMGTGIGGLKKSEAAQIIVKEVQGHTLDLVTLIDLDQEMVDEFKKALKTIA